MAEPDETPRLTGSGILDPLIGAGFFSPNMSLEEIKRRRAIAGALASRARAFPKNIGEGMTYFGESIAAAVNDYTTGQAEKDYNARYNARANAPDPGAAPPPPITSGPSASLPMVTANASLNAGAVPVVAQDDGETFAEEGNPPIIRNDIRPMMMAQATPRPGTLPAAPVQPTAQPGGTLAPVIPESLPLPTAPMRSERMTPNELRRYNELRDFPGDPRAIREYNQAHELGKAAREAEYERAKAEHDVKMRAYEARETAIQAAKTNAPKTQQELAKGAAELSAAQAAEQSRLQWGNLPAPVQKDLFESRDSAKAAAGSIGALNNAEAVLDAGTAIGPFANQKLLYYKTLAQIGNENAQRIVANTQTFQASLGPAVMAAVKSYGGSQISNTDREYAAAMVGSDITLSEPAVRRILDIARRSAKAAMEEHRSKADEHAKDAPALRKFLEVSDPLAASPKISETKPAETPPRVFATEAEAATARLPRGTPVIINGRRGRIQ